MEGVFISGTDTGVGKTVVAAALAYKLKKQGIDVGVMKPVSTGGKKIGGRLVSEDAIFLAKYAEVNDDPTLISPVCLKLPLAPYIAAKMEKKRVDLNKVHQSFKRLKSKHQFLIVEGIGGLLVPIKKNFYVIDLIKMWRLPLILVCRAGLGTINHTLLCIKTCEVFDINIKGIFINRYPTKNADIAEKTNPKVLKELGIKILGILPEDKEIDEKKFWLGNKFLQAMEKTNLNF